ncbi:right-handed parallel beta-helix repeat-containing protein [Xanthovirga aplysinae]|uniref:right-handed parallel beta-helix repeat-containing protein n=1 Tax=Xanthovirga aplysinae TaxID=2529853 RepID=UPI0012BD0C79|nr:right-handed parallel beta-helix repeat-containing protein [Xanthovirga aplysinae]MTI33389.1 right-handed parallel beta-helix repeat-containing protein [Xanthovirga aplysinae]
MMTTKLVKRAIGLFLFNCISLFLVAQNGFEKFDWDSYRSWENTTAYSKTIVVNQRHPKASDENPGTLELPLKTINKAAQLVKAGERILIYSGIYRETIRPKNEGSGAEKMISYESAPGERVIIRGSRILNTSWEQRQAKTDAIDDSTFTYSWSRKIWMTKISDDFFEYGYYPFKLPNITPEEHKLMPWAKLVKELAPYNSKRALIFQNGKRMIQLEDYGDLSKVPGSFWVSQDGETVHIHPFGGKDPNNDFFEVGVQSYLFKPQKIGMGYIQIRGLTFEHCANGFLRTSTGAVTALGGHHWIIEDNTIRQNNSSGLEFGYYAFEFKDPNPENIQPRRDEDLGGMIIRNNLIYECGTAGIRSYSVKEGIITNNEIYNCGWQDAENYWECSGIKILKATKTLVKGNHIYNIQGGNGIWLDWDIQFSRVTANIIHDIQNIQGGIFVEASKVPNLVDNNFIWNIDGNGIYGNDTDYLMVYHNLVANTTGPLVNAVVATKRKLNGKPLTANYNKVFNNIFIDGGKPITFDGIGNQADNNLYVSTQFPSNVDLSDWQKIGFGSNSQGILAITKFLPENLFFVLDSKQAIQNVPIRPEIKRDFNSKLRKGSFTVPGPFATITELKKISLLESSPQPGLGGT